MINKVLFSSVILLISIFSNLHSQTIQLSDSAQISLLTHSPDNREIYALFGHTAIRVSDEANSIDYVFNYGLFDFNSPNFFFRFAEGKTDYMVGAINFEYYLQEYQMRQVSVSEQVLNLTTEEKQKIWNGLCINTLPENREYRYNFFFDNCSTRPRDIIENNVSDVISYHETNKKQTLRDLIHECVNSQPWVRFGIDMIIGNGADREATEREKMFLPIYLFNAYSKAVITDGNEHRNLVLSEKNILTFDTENKLSSPTNYPLLFGVQLFVFCLILSYVNYTRKLKFTSKLFDTLLFATAGVCGSVIFFLMFFSVHPATNPNWNIIWLNPLQLIVACLFFVKYLSKYLYYYHFINFVCLSLFLVLWFLIPQHLEIAFIPFILSLWLRSGINIVEHRKGKVDSKTKTK